MFAWFTKIFAWSRLIYYIFVRFFPNHTNMTNITQINPFKPLDLSSQTK